MHKNQIFSLKNCGMNILFHKDNVFLFYFLVVQEIFYRLNLWMQNTMVLGKNNNVVLRILFPLVICRSVKLGPSQRNIPQIIFCYQIKEQVLISDFVWLWGFRIQKPSYLAIGSSLVSNDFQFIVSWGCLRNFLMGLLPTPNQENMVFFTYAT